MHVQAEVGICYALMQAPAAWPAVVDFLISQYARRRHSHFLCISNLTPAQQLLYSFSTALQYLWLHVE